MDLTIISWLVVRTTQSLVSFFFASVPSTMYYSVAIDRPIRTSSFSKLPKPELATRRRQLSQRFFNPPEQKNLSLNASSSGPLLNLRLPRGSSSEFRSQRVKVSSDDAQFASPEEKKKKKKDVVQAPSFAEFITSERVKVVAMVALSLALCNADRVVMSVAIVPLSLSHGWSRSFSGIVQVGFTAPEFFWNFFGIFFFFFI